MRFLAEELTVDRTNHRSERRLGQARCRMGNIGTNNDRWIFTKEWMIALVKVTGSATQLRVELHSNIRAVLRLGLLNML